MNCPFCSSEDTKVTDSRVSSDGTAIRRRRECTKCEERFSTIEQFEILDLTVIKRDGRRVPYTRENIQAGLVKALEKLPYTSEELRALVLEIEIEISRERKDEISTQDIGEIVMSHLKNFNAVAYIRFASVYGAWQEPGKFKRALAEVLKNEKT